jgi:hypothetical protein
MTAIPTQPPAMPIPTPPRPSRWKSWLVALGIFVGGLAVGAGLTLVVSVRMIREAIQHPEEAPARLTVRLSRRLGLDNAQAEQVRQIVARRQKAVQEIRRSTQPRVEKEIAQLETEVAAVLDARQRIRWRGMIETLRENWLPPMPAAENQEAGQNPNQN